MKRTSSKSLLRRYLVGQPSKEVVDVSELVVHHKGQHTHLGGTALVQFLSTVVVLGFFGVGTDESNGEARSGEVTREGSFSLLPSGKLEDTAEGENLEGSRNRNREGGIPTRSKVRELGSISGDVTREVDTSLVDKVSNNTKHADAAMLDLNTTEAIKLFLITIGDKAERIEESKRTVVRRRNDDEMRIR